MRKEYQFGLMLEKIHHWRAPDDCVPYYRFFSGKMHGPVCPTRREALWLWFTNRFFN